VRLLTHLLELEGDNGDKRKAGQYQERTPEKDYLCDWRGETGSNTAKLYDYENRNIPTFIFTCSSSSLGISV